MPRIDAPTLAEHRLKQREALLAAGRDLLASEGADAVTPAAVGAAAGLARSSVYQYFPSSEALLEAIIDLVVPGTSTALARAVAEHGDPHDQLAAYVDAAFTYATGSQHLAFDALATDGLPAAIKDKLDSIHRGQLEPLVGALASAGVPHPSVTALLVSGMLSAAVRAVREGADKSEVRLALLEAVRFGPGGAGTARGASDL